jgi:hypothetical protein
VQIFNFCAWNNQCQHIFIRTGSQDAAVLDGQRRDNRLARVERADAGVVKDQHITTG